MLRLSIPTFDYLPWQISHSLFIYIQSLTTASGSRLFGSVIRALDFISKQTGFEYHDRREIFSAMLHSFVATFMS